jgi:hypothetical protein
MRMLVIDMVLEHPVPLAVYIIVYLHVSTPTKFREISRDPWISEIS